VAAVLQFKWFSWQFFLGTLLACHVARAVSIFGLSFMVNMTNKLERGFIVVRDIRYDTLHYPTVHYTNDRRAVH
jgi:hypothetical protein